MFNNFEMSLMVFMPNITTNHAITYTNRMLVSNVCKAVLISLFWAPEGLNELPEVH